MKALDRFRYQKVATEPERSSHSEKIDQPKHSWTVILVCILFGAIVTGSLVALFDEGRQCPAIKPKQFVVRPCGDSADEATAAGCIFDPMMNSWLSEDCYDEELSLEFRSLRDWAFYKDEAATRRLTDDEFSRVGDSWGTWVSCLGTLTPCDAVSGRAVR